MGYTTDFEGEFSIEPPLDIAQTFYLRKLAETRRMKRDPAVVEKMPDRLRVAVGLPVGEEGEFYVAANGFHGQSRDNVVDYNDPPSSQPSLWLQWQVSEEGDSLAWDGGEKFYAYGEWLAYMLKNFFVPWGRTLNGSVEWQGEDTGDRGCLIIEDNVLTRRKYGKRGRKEDEILFKPE